MKSPKSSGKPKRRKSFFLRRIVGQSMSPTLNPGDMVLAYGRFRSLAPGNIVVARHDGLEKIKRIQAIKNAQVFLVGDNPAHSTDSRSFGWLDQDAIIGKVVWPRQ